VGLALTAGVVSGAIDVVFSVSMAALVFSGEMAKHRAVGVSVLLLSATVLALVVALSSRLHGSVAIPQDTVGAIGAVISVAIVERIGSGQDAVATVIVGLAVASLALGVFQVVLGGLSLGNLVRFVPYPVIGGFLAGTGWLLARGAIGVMTNSGASLSDLDTLFSSDGLARWVPGLVFAVALLAAVKRISSVWTIPVAVVGGVAVVYAVLFATGTGLDQARAEGWLFASGEAGVLWPPRIVSAVGDADWGAIAAQAPQIGTMVLIATVALLLNGSGIELAVRREVDLNAELRSAGLANVAVGVAGGVAGYHSLSLSVLAMRMAGPSRLVGLVAAAVCGGVLLSGPSAISYLPTTILGGLLLYLGLGFLYEWVWEARRRLPVADYVVMLLILVVIGGFGFLPGVTVGLVAAIVLFVLDSSRTDVVRYRLYGETFASSVERPSAERDALHAEGHRIDVLVLHGFLFFGSANRLLEECRKWAADDRVDGPLYLVLDFRLVRGLDSSAAITLEKIRRLAEDHDAVLVLSGMDPSMRRRLEHHGLKEDTGLRFEEDVDRAVEWCEDALLSWLGVRAAEGVGDALAGRFPPGVDVERVRGFLEPMDVEPGQRVFSQDEPSNGLYLVESAVLSLELQLNDGTVRRLRQLMPGTMVGETGLYLDWPRQVSVVVEQPGRIYRLGPEEFARMEREAPEVAAAFHKAVAGLLAFRLGSLVRNLEDQLR
jgi:SulP family sulfate permease